MKNIFAIMMVGILVSGCGEYARSQAQLVGYSKVCVDHVTYLQFPSGVTVQVDQEGKPVRC